MSEPITPGAALPRNATLLFGAGLAAGLLLVAAAFWPGLAGPFLFDDLGSLGDLGRYGGVDNWHTFKQFVFGGVTGPTGRPLSLLTFLIDGTDWPTEPWPFKRTNLVIHGINAVLLGLVARQILDLLNYRPGKAAAIAVFCAIAWAAHPFLVSTVLYPVQRMAQLAALFSFAGLSLYLYGRQRLTAAPRKAYVAMSIAVAVFTVLATLSKENGALLPLLIAVAELTVVASRKDDLGRLDRRWSILFLGVPSALVAAYLLRIGLVTDLSMQHPSRNFSTFERLMTEPRILFDYLRHWFLPSLYTSGIFQDHVVKSTGLLQPMTTLVAIFLHAAILAFAWVSRLRRPLLAFAVLFFYAGHLLESTVVALELYFEHRNYLPAAFLLLPPAAWVADRVPVRLASFVGVVAILLFATFTRYSSGIWASYADMVEAAAGKAPHSARAQQQYASLLLNEGRALDAINVTERALEYRPGDPNLTLWRAILLCKTGLLDAAEFNSMADTISQHPFDLRSLNGYETLIASVARDECEAVSPAMLRAFLNDMLEHPVNANPSGPMYAQLTYLNGQVDLLLEEPQSAMANFAASLASRPGAGRAMAMAATLAGLGYFEQAMRMSDTALGYYGEDGVPAGEPTGVTRADIAEFQMQLRSAMNP